jgi:hypothetical protein
MISCFPTLSGDFDRFPKVLDIGPQALSPIPFVVTAECASGMRKQAE